VSLLKSAFIGFVADDCKTMAAALAYYALFALPPLLYLLLTVVTVGMSFAYGAEDAESRAGSLIQSNVTELVGNETAVQELRTMLNRSHSDEGAWWKSLLSLVVMLFVGTGIVTAVQTSLNRVWGVRVDPAKIGVKNFVLKRGLSFGMIVGLGFLLLLSTLASFFLTAVGAEVRRWLGLESELWSATNSFVGFVLTFSAFATMLKFMPSVIVRWRDVLFGALVTGILFIVGRHALAIYFAHADLAARVGSAATSLAVVLVWVYYSSMIFLLGAEFTKAFAIQYGNGVVPSSRALRMEKTLVREEVTQGDRAVDHLSDDASA
jgi:membrane protein